MRDFKLVILDRDGVINRHRHDSVKSPEEFMFLPGAAEAIARLNRAGLKTAIATNQSIVGKGIITEKELTRIHAKMRDELAVKGAVIDLILFAPDAPEKATNRRKPGPGMLKEAMVHFGVSAQETLFIGDNWIDYEAAQNASCAFGLVLTGLGQETKEKLKNKAEPIFICQDLADAVDRLLR